MTGPANYLRIRSPFIANNSNSAMFMLPIKTVGGLNAREHWQTRSNRVRRERSAARLAVESARLVDALPCIVTMTRLSSGELDDDNLQGACKAIRDGVADGLGIDDRDPRVTWLYRQERCKRGEFGLRVHIEAVAHVPLTEPEKFAERA